jgi:signal transduction histidine kinase
MFCKLITFREIFLKISTHNVMLKRFRFFQTFSLTIFQRFFAAALTIACVAIGAVSLFYDREAESAILQRSFDQLSSVRTLKKSKVEDYFASIRAMLSVVGSHPATILTSAREMRLRYDIQDILVFSSQGQCVYALQDSAPFVSHNADYDSVWAAIQPTIQPVLAHSTEATSVSFTDFTRLRGEVIAFGMVRIDSPLVAPSLQSNPLPFRAGNTIVVQIPIRVLNRILAERIGLGETGESYLVGSDSLMRTDSRFLKESTILRLAVQTEPVRRALRGEAGCVQTKDYRNVEVLSAFEPLRIGELQNDGLQNSGLQWAILSELDVDEITTPIAATRRRITLIAVGVLLFMATLSWYGARALSEPIVRLQEHLSAIARGNLPATPLTIKRTDEIGAMTNELNVMTASLREATLFAKDIGEGRFDAEYTPRSESDMLVIALNSMKRELLRLLADEQSRALQRTMALIEGEERERIRISRDVHDGVGQILTALRFNLIRIGDEQIRNELFDLADDAITEVRAVSYNLMPGVLVDFGLEAALENLCSKTSEASQILIQRDISPLRKRLDAPREIAVYRIAQEALSNAIRYSGATELIVKLLPNTDQTALALSIQDNGKGFEMALHRQGNGLANMRERATLFGGNMRIESGINSGTQISVEIPIT